MLILCLKLYANSFNLFDKNLKLFATLQKGGQNINGKGMKDLTFIP
jgi:hypothetical protein